MTLKTCSDNVKPLQLKVFMASTFLEFFVLTERYDLKEDFAALGNSKLTGHGGADFFTMESFINAVKVCIVS